MKFFALVCLAVAIPALSSASFELALIADGTKIHRFDPETGIYFGSFGRFGGGIRDIATDQTTGFTFAADFNGYITKYNYSSGNQESAVAQGNVTSLNMVGNELWAQQGWTITRYNQNLVSLGTVTIASTNTMHSMHYLNGKLFTLESLSGTALTRRYSLTGAFEASLGSYANFTSSLGKMGSIRYNYAGSTDLLLSGVRLSGSDLNAYSILTGTNSTSHSTYSHSTITTVRDFAATHVGGIYVGQNPANLAQGGFTVLGPGASEFPIMGTSILLAPSAVNVIVAPEPASLLAFGLGGLLLLRRKR